MIYRVNNKPTKESIWVLKNLAQISAESILGLEIIISMLLKNQDAEKSNAPEGNPGNDPPKSKCCGAIPWWFKAIIIIACCMLVVAIIILVIASRPTGMLVLTS